MVGGADYSTPVNNPETNDLLPTSRTSRIYLNRQKTNCVNISCTRCPPGIGYFYDISSREFWRHMWIVQEISVATYIWIVCGNS